jgi:hypothetical protein
LGHSVATLAGTITNHNQNTTDVANSSNTNTTTSLDGITSCCDLQRERGRGELILMFDVRVFWCAIVSVKGMAEVLVVAS